MLKAKTKKMSLAEFQEHKEEKPKYVISFLSRSPNDVARWFVANATNPSAITFVSTEKQACYFQYSKEVVGIFASSTAGCYCDILIAKECTTPASQALIENPNFEEEIMLVRRNKANCRTYFSGGHKFI